MFHRSLAGPSLARATRGFGTATAILLVLALVAPIVRAQSQAALVPPHSDTGVDTDLDTLFNVLRIDVNLDVTVAGFFFLAADLYDNSGAFYITSGGVSGFLGVGPTALTIDLPGLDIYTSGFDGPYTAELFVYDDVFNLDDFGVHMTGPYLSTDFDPPGAAFAPPHSDTGVDPDGDMLLDILRVNAVVDVTTAGSYDVSAQALDGFFTPITNTYVTVALPAGPGQTVAIDFAGWPFRANGVDGPYFVDMYLYESFGPFLDNDFHTTAAYLATDFEMPPGSLTPPHSDRGVDTDGDMLFNAIEVGVSVQIDSPGDYIVEVQFYDQFFATYLGGNSSFVTLATGSHVVPVWKTTLDMVLAGIDGPYAVDISLRDGAFNLIDQGAYLTGAYSTPQFDPIPAMFAPPHADAGEDRDVPPDGQFNVLRVDVSVDVSDVGTYLIFADLWDAGLTTIIASEFRVVTLSPGVQTVPVYFSGVTIRQSGIDGPYVVNMGLLLAPFFLFLDTDTHVTGPYLATNFQNVVPEILSGTVRDSLTAAPLPGAGVIALDYQNVLVRNGVTDGAGAYAVPVHQGNWVVLYDEMVHDAALVSTTIMGPTTVDVNLDPSTPQLVLANATLATWDTLELMFTGFLETDIALLRAQIDWFLGDRDQILTQGEFDAFLQFVGGPTPTPLNSTWDQFLTDSIWYELVPGSDAFAWRDAPGPIDSTVPIRILETAKYQNATIAPAATHTIDVKVTYDTPYEDNQYNVVLPASFVLVSFTGAPAVTISGLGTGTAAVDPGADPNPFDGIDFAWIQLVANSPDVTDPVVSSAGATPDPVLVGSTVTVTAQASDDVGLASVRLEAWDPSATLVVDVAMNPVGGGTYEYAFSPSVPGTYTFTVTATDFAGHTAARNGQFSAIELNPPSIQGTGATPDPVEYGQSVLLFAIVTDDFGVAAVTAEVRDPSGGFVGNFTMAYNAGTGQWETTQTVSELGIVAFTVWATDTSGNVASAPDSFVIEDTTDPTLTGASATPDPVEAGSPVRISVTASDLAGLASVQVEVRDPIGAIAGTFTMSPVAGEYEYDFTPTDLGAYTFTITATDTSGNTASAPGSFTSQDTANPVANAGGDQTVDVGTTVTFDGSASSDNHGVVDYTWTFTEGGQTVTLTGDKPTHAFSAAGTYVVTLRVEDESGNFATDTVTITVRAAGGGPSPGIPSWIWLLVVVVIVGIVAALLLLRRKKAAAAPLPPSPPPESVPPPSPSEAPPLTPPDAPPPGPGNP